MSPADHAAARSRLLAGYWRTNLIVLAILLTVWAVAGIGCGVLFADTLNQYRFFGTGYPLGFWFAQQGSIIVFVFVILAYCLIMNRLDSTHRAQLDQLDREASDRGGSE